MSDHLDLIKEISLNVREIKATQQQLVAQGAVMNQTLIEHERRSTNLETRFLPVEEDHKFMRKSASLVLIVIGSGILTFIGGMVKLFKG